MANDFYNAGGVPPQGSGLTSPNIRAEFAAIQAGFSKLPTITGNAYKIVYVNASDSALDVIGGNGLLKLSYTGIPSIAVPGTDYQEPLVAGTDYLAPGYIHAAAIKASPDDGDEVGIQDSASSFAQKKTTIAAIKAVFKTYFDSIYTTVAAIALRLVSQTDTAATTTGTAPTVAFTSILGNSVAYAAGQKHHLKFNVSGVTTVARDGLANVNLKQYDSTGAKVTAVTVAGMLADVEHDGTDYVILNPLPIASSTSSPLVRQTVLSGPVDSSGLPAFGGATGSTSVTASGTLKVTAMAGGDANYTGSITNPSWTGLSTNGTMFLCLDITSAGVVSASSMTLAPIQQLGGAYSTANGQMTINVNEGVAKLGNGTSATQIFRTVVGEVSVTGGVVTSIVWYALMGRYQSADTTIPALGTNTSFNHNIGLSYGSVSFTPQPNITAWLRCYTTDNGWAVGDVVPFIMDLTSTHVGQPTGAITGRNTACTVTGANSPIVGITKTTGGMTVLTAANWKQFIVVSRGW